MSGFPKSHNRLGYNDSMTTEMPKRGLYRYLKEPVNSLTHFAGIVLSIAALVLLLVFSRGEVWRTVSFSIYGTASIVLFTASTLLHSLRVKEEKENYLRIFDHASIFVLIAGTYTPISLITLRQSFPAWAWTIFGIAWGIAVLGVAFKLFWIKAPRFISTGLYLIMGWMALVAIAPIIKTMPLGGFVWMLIGGLFYSVGAVVYALKKPDFIPYVFGYHELWHLFVLAGSISHFVMMYKYVLPV